MNLSIAVWHDENAKVKCEHHGDMPDEPCLLALDSGPGQVRHWMTEHTLEVIHRATGELLAKLRGQRAALSAPIAPREAYVAAELPTS